MIAEYIEMMLHYHSIRDIMLLRYDHSKILPQKIFLMVKTLRAHANSALKLYGMLLFGSLTSLIQLSK